MKNLSTILLLSLTACSGGVRSFAIEDEFTPHEVDLIYEAADQWVEATDSDDAAFFFREDLIQDGEFNVDRHWDGGDQDFGYIWKIYTDESGYKDLQEKNGSFIGIARKGSKNRIAIVADKMDSDDEFLVVMLHEFGHVLGLGHQDGGLMTKGNDNDKGPCIDKWTLESYCQMYECGANAGPTCN